MAQFLYIHNIEKNFSNLIGYYMGNEVRVKDGVPYLVEPSEAEKINRRVSEINFELKYAGQLIGSDLKQEINNFRHQGTTCSPIYQRYGIVFDKILKNCNNMKKTQTYTKINTLYCRYKNLNKIKLPNPDWKFFQNKIILGQFSDDYMDYIKNLKFDCFSKIDGTNSKIVYFPSTNVCFCGGKTDNADIIHTGQKEYLDNLIERIKPILAEMFPPESARFIPKMNDKNQIEYHSITTNEILIPDHERNYAVNVEEAPVYIYGEFFGKKIQAGGNYDKDNNRFSIFDICVQGWWIPIDMLNEYAEKLGIDVVPYLGQMTIHEAEEMVKSGFKTHVPNVTNPDYLEEGIVARPVIPIKDPRGKRIIVKIKTCDYNELTSAINKVGIEEYEKFNKWYFENKIDEI